MQVLVRAILLAATVTSATAATQITEFQEGEDMPGGDATHNRRINSNSFSHASANLKFNQELNFKVGNGFFRRVWVSSPSSTQAADGLGPLFNSRGCQRCHIKDGRGHPPLEHEKTSESLLLRLSIPPQNDSDIAALHSGEKLNIPEPVYGHQLQSHSVLGVVAEGNIDITHHPYPVNLPNGETVTLLQPEYRVSDLGYGPLHQDVRLSPRIAPQMIGLGLLEAISLDDILALADPQDENNDGISGHPNLVLSKELGQNSLGRFGHKAGVATINEQNQGAFSGDIGISTPLFPGHAGDCTVTQSDCLNALHGNSPQYDDLEVHQEIVDLLLFYTRNLAVPARRDPKNPDVLKGKQLFHDIGCASCHQPNFITEDLPDRPEHSVQKIWPYTDLLLHDMGEGLADHATEGKASGTEWRTAPLWGIGLTEVVNGHSRFLHDGRARSIEEAIWWHGGEAESARNHYGGLPTNSRQQLLQFIKSL